MTKEELHIKAIDNANSRVQSIDKRYIASLADYDLGLIQGFEDGAMYMKGLNDGQALFYAVEKTAERTKKEVIEKAVEWMRNNLQEFSANVSYKNLFTEFKQAMEK